MTSDLPTGPDGTVPSAVAEVERKRARRRELLARRRSLRPADVASASDRIVARLRALDVVRTAGTIVLYAADADEVDLGPLLDAPPSGCTVLLPRVERDRLVVVRHAPGGQLAVGALGVREPVGPASDPAEADVVVVPGVAFSPSGDRLGRGGGFYDRFLSLTPGATRIGVCLEQFVVAELPVEAHDVPMDFVVTDASVRRRDAVDRDPPA